MKTAVVIACLMTAATAEYVHLVHKIRATTTLVTTTIQAEVDYFIAEA